MTEVNVDLKANDQMSSVLTQVTQRLGLFNKAGLAMGVSFALINQGISLLFQGFSYIADSMMKAINSTRELQLQLVYATNTINDMDITIKMLRGDLEQLSMTFGDDINALAGNLRIFTREGHSATDSLKLLSEAELFSKATGQDLADTADAMQSAMEVFGLGTGDSIHILNKFNDLVSQTGMEAQDISNILARAAPDIRKSGLSLDEVVNILYTLHSLGDSPRSMLRDIGTVLKDIGKLNVKILPEGKELTPKFKEVEKTNKNFWDRFGQVMSIGAQQSVDAVGGIFDNWVRSSPFLSAVEAGIGNAMTPTPILPEMKEPKVPDVIQKYRDKIQYLKEYAKAIQALHNAQAQAAASERAWNSAIEVRDYTVAMHDATAAVKEQQDAIDALQRISDQYSISQMQNSLEIMKIQYNADARHGLTREEKDRVKELEHENQGIQIQEQENQIAIAQIRANGLQNALDEQDKIQRNHDEYEYEQKLIDLNADVAAKNASYLADLQNVADAQDTFDALKAAWREHELASHTTWAANMHAQTVYAYSDSGSAPQNVGGSTSASDAISQFNRLMGGGYQHGGPVTETGLAMVHEGEFVIPKGGAIRSSGGGSGSHNVTISIVAELHKDVDVEDWGRQLGAGLQSGFLNASSSGTTTQTSHRGATVIVPGTSVNVRTGRAKNPDGTTATSLPIIQPITNKGRFRRG